MIHSFIVSEYTPHIVFGSIIIGRMTPIAIGILHVSVWINTGTLVILNSLNNFFRQSSSGNNAESAY